MTERRTNPVQISQYETLKIMFNASNQKKRLYSKHGDGMVPKEGCENDFSIWEAHERNLRELIRKLRFGEEVTA